MAEIPVFNANNINTPAINGEDSFILDAHTSSNMKVERPKVSSTDFSVALSKYSKYSHAESKQHLKKLDKDIYQRANKEKNKHEFNFKRYFTIFGILGLLTAAIAYFRKGK